MHFSSRIAYGSINPIAAEEAFDRSQGITFSKLNDANPTLHGLAPSMLSATYRADPRGPLESRSAIAAYIARHNSSAHVDAAHLYVLSSTSQAYSWLMKLLCDSDDAILVPKPGYPLVDSIARLECVRSISYPLHFDGSWTIDIGAIEEQLAHGNAQRIRAIVLINPNNPTASYVQEWEREQLIHLCQRYGIAIIADEVFFAYSLHDGIFRQRFAGEQQVLTFALDGFSKMLAAPHAKVGWIQVSGPEEEVTQALGRLDSIADDYLPMSTIIADQIAKLLSLADGQLAKVRKRVRTNYVTLEAMVAARSTGYVDVMPAQAGWNVLLRFPSVIDEDALVLALLREHRLSAQPGYFFDMPFAGVLAVSLLPETDVFHRRIQLVLDHIDILMRQLIEG